MATPPIPAGFPVADDDAVAALQGAVNVLAAKWSVVVLARLASGTQRFNELLRQIDLVERHVYARVPARVEYELSPVGENLLVALAPLAGWGLANQSHMSDARERFDRLQRWRVESEELQARSQSTPRIV